MAAGIRSSFRTAVELVVARTLLGLLRLSSLRAGVLLVYHAIDERSGDPRRELVAPHGLPLFRAQLRHLARHYRPVPAAEILTAAAERRRGRRFPVAVTFDDDLASHRLRAAPALASHGIPATFFLTGASLEQPASFWWQRLQRASDLGLDVPIPGSNLHERAARIEAMNPDEREDVAAQLELLVGGETGDAGLRTSDVAALAAAGFEIGFHTLRHDRLTELDGTSLALALQDGRERLAEAAGKPLDSIAYPHGVADGRVAAAARRAGFRLGLTGRYERVSAASEPLLLGRVEPTFEPGAAFPLQLVRVLMRAQR
jgi:peptidoglycan/xylan/chitin deacetylase (PgdA/CDA1 family)